MFSIVTEARDQTLPGSLLARETLGTRLSENALTSLVDQRSSENTKKGTKVAVKESKSHSCRGREEEVGRAIKSQAFRCNRTLSRRH